MKKLTRREFMRGMAAGAVGVAAASVLGGCGGSSSTAPAGGSSSAAPADNGSAAPADNGGEAPETADAAAAAEYGPEVTMIFSNVTTQCSKDAGTWFKEEIEKRSGGMIKIDLYQDNILGDDQTATESTQIGDIQIVVTATSPLVSTYPDYYIYDTPYMFSSREQVMEKGLFSDFGKKIWQGISEKGGLRGASVWENGFRNLTNSKREVKTLADVKGLKLRTMDNDVHLAAWTAMGANPSPMAFSELYTALQQGTMDGQENPFAIIVSNKFYEVNKFISMTEHIWCPHVVLMNPAAYDALTDKQKELFDAVMDEATTKQFEIAAQLESTAVADCEAGGATVTELTPEAKAEFQQCMVDNDIMGMVQSKMDHPEYMDEMLALLAE